MEQAEEMELLSLDPEHRDEAKPGEAYRRKVIGKTTVTDRKTRGTLLAALDHAMPQHNLGRKSCFDPRHAIRVRHQGKTYYLSICFECDHVYVYVDDEIDGALYFETSQIAEPVFDAVLRDAGVPLAEKAGLQE